MQHSRLISLALPAYILTVALGIEAINSAWGNLLPDRGPPQYGSGRGKMRPPLHEFQTVLLLLGTWVYPACVIAARAFIRQSAANKNRRQKILLFSCAVLCLAVLGRFFWLGVFTKGVGLE